MCIQSSSDDWFHLRSLTSAILWTQQIAQLCTARESWVPHISLVFREMWEDHGVPCATLDSWARALEMELSGRCLARRRADRSFGRRMSGRTWSRRLPSKARRCRCRKEWKPVFEVFDKLARKHD